MLDFSALERLHAQINRLIRDRLALRCVLNKVSLETLRGDTLSPETIAEVQRITAPNPSEEER